MIFFKRTLIKGLKKYLKKRNTYERFMANANNPNCLGIFDAENNPKDVSLNDAFDWSKTPEGHEYWSRLAERF